MSYLQVEVIWSRNGVNQSIPGVVSDGVITDWTNMVIRRGIDAKANTTEITLINPLSRIPSGETKTYHKYIDDNGELYFRENDVFTIKAKYSNQLESLSSSDILTIADLTEWNVKLDKGKSTIRLKCVDKTFNLLNRLWVSNYTLSAGLNSAEIIQNVIQNATDNTGSGVFEITATLQTELTYAGQKASATPGIQTRRIDDSAFPDTSITKLYKPVYEWIDDLSSVEHTNDFNNRNGGGAEDEENPVQDRKMRYFVDKDNNFRWFYPDDDVDYTIDTCGVTDNNDDMSSVNLTKSTFDIINHVIFNAGQDLYGAGILNNYFDSSTKSSKTLTKYKAYTEVARDLIQDEINSGNLVANASGEFTFQGNLYTNNTYGFTTSWGVDTTGFSDDDYNDSLRDESTRLAKAKARSLTQKRGSPRWKGSIEKKGTNFVPGEVINLTHLPGGVVSQNLRIQDVTHNINNGGWRMSISLEEDEPKIGG